MNRDIQILREAVTKVVQMLAQIPGLKVTQRGSQAFVQTDKKTLKPILVNIPFIPDDASQDLILAIQGFLDHEVAHILYTKWEAVRDAYAVSDMLGLTHNIVEDTFIERKITKDFPGCGHNLSQLHDFFIRKITQPALDKLDEMVRDGDLDPKDLEKERFNVILVPLVRAWSGQHVFADFLKDNGHYDNPFVKNLVAKMPPAEIIKVAKVPDSFEALRLAKIILAIIQPPAPPAQQQAPQPQPKQQSSSQQKQDGKGKGEKDHKESSKNADGDQNSGEQPDDATNEDGEGDGKSGSTPSKDGKSKKSKSKEKDKNAEKDDEESQDSDPGQDGPGKDPEGSGDQDGHAEGAEGDSDRSDAGDDANDAEDGSGRSDKASEGDGAESDPGEDQGDRGAERGDADRDDQDDASSGAGGAEDDADSDRGSDEGEPDDGRGAGDSDSDEDEDEEGEAGQGGQGDEREPDAEGQDGSGRPGEEGQDDRKGESRKESRGTKAEKEAGEAGKGDVDIDDTLNNGAVEADGEEAEGSNTPGIGHIEGDFEDAGINPYDFDSMVRKHITDEAVRQTRDADYAIYSTDFDIVEKHELSAAYKDEQFVKMDEAARQMMGVMQREIERMMAQRNRVFNLGGQKRGKLNAPGFHRLLVNDDRVFKKKVEHHAKDTAVALLCDNSGSMSGDACRVAMSAAYALCATLERVGLNSEVIGFTTSNRGKPGSGYSYQKIAEEEMRLGINYSRATPLRLTIFKDFAERLTPPVRQRFADMAYNQPNMGANVDGESVQFAINRLLKRKEQRKVILVLSDGFPSAGDTTALYSHLHKVVADAAKAKVELIGVGIQSDAVKTFYPKYMILNRIEDLPKMVMGELKRILMAA